MKLLHKFHVHIDQKKYNLRIYEQREQNVYMMTVGDYGKFLTKIHYITSQKILIRELYRLYCINPYFVGKFKLRAIKL